MKKQLLIIALLSFSISSAQTKVGGFINTLKTSSGKLKNVTPIVNEENGDFAMVLTDAKRAYAYLFNKEYKKIGEINLEDKARKYRRVLGKGIIDGNFMVYLSNNIETKFAAVSFNFKEQKSEFKEFELDLTNQEIVQTLHYKGKFYLITQPSESFSDKT